MQSFNLNLVPGSFQQVFNCSQGDVDRQLTIRLFDGSAEYTVPVGATVKIKATKPSGFGFDESATFSGSAVTITTTETMTNEWGRFPAELEITSEGLVIGTANFLFNVEKNPHPASTVDGDAEEVIPELTLLVERVEAAASSVLDMEVVAETLPAGSQATYSYDEDLNKATFGIPQGEAGAGAAGVVASAYSSSKTYKVGDYAIHNSNLYRCITAITTAEAWTAAHWTQVVLADDVADLKSDFNNTAELLNNKNLANPYDPNYVEGVYIKADGTYTTSSLFNTTGFIPVSGGEKIVGSYKNNGSRANAYLRFMCCYDETKTPIPGKYVSSESQTYTVPSDVAFVRISIGVSYWNELMLEFGTVRSAYVAPNNIYTPIRIADESITKEKLANYEVVDGYNMAPIAEQGGGVFYNSSGTLTYIAPTGAYANYKYYIMPVEAGKLYTFDNAGGNAKWVDFTDDSGTITGGLNNAHIKRFIAPVGSTKMYVTYDSSLYPDGLLIGQGEEVKENTKWTADWLGINFDDRAIRGIAIANRVYCSLPSTIYMNTSEAVKIYLNDILSQDGSHFWCNSPAGLTMFINDEYLQITCDTVGSYTLDWKVFDSNLQQIDGGTSTVKVSDLSSLTSKKGLIIGDSFVAYGALSSAMISQFSEQSKTLTLIGTRGESPNYHEGRGGWSAETYCTVSSAGDFTNPFYHNNTFDFSYYMTQNNYSGLDYVFINLGINKIFNLEFADYKVEVARELKYYKMIIDSIHDYDSNIKIFCNLPTPPNSVNGKFSESYGTAQMGWLYANNIKHYAKDMIDNISGTNVYIVGTNYVFDTDTDIADGVHPTTDGYPILARATVNAVIGS